MYEPLVLLPGTMCDARLFSEQMLALGNRRAITVVPMTGAQSIGGLASAVLDAAPRKFALAGHSLGGIVAMEVLRRAPERVSRIALMDTNPMPESPQSAAAREPHIIAAMTGRLMEIMREVVKPSYLAPGPGRVEVTNQALDMAAGLGADVFVAQSRALQRRPDQQKTLRMMSLPTLILCGEHDTLCPVRGHEFMAELISEAELQVIPDAGHYPTLEQPELTTDALRTWLGEPMMLR